ncbi:MAG: methylmalonyl Co-A mutase-associated GTPase MeaB [Pseudomonadota bacterium]
MDATDSALVAGVLARERRALAKAITLVESTRADHRLRAQALLEALMPQTGGALRIGLSGAPGAGKSTFIERLGIDLIGRGLRVAVLAVDPSSSVNGGSILGDKTRMEALSLRDEAFIRPSPSSGALGGVAHQTREALLLCEAAGFDVVIVETVGVGQSEVAVAGMTDLFVVLQLAHTGDELQGIKKGILELADLVIYNKADIDARATELACGQMRSALHMVRGHSAHWQVPVLQASALTGAGMVAAWDSMQQFRTSTQESGEFEARRKRQALQWTWAMIDEGMKDLFRQHQAVRAELDATLGQVADGTLAPAAAAARLLHHLKT